MINLLDCTLRDGGYYNNWDFDENLVKSYINSMVSSKIDVVEIGFRSLPQNSFMGPFFYSSDDFLENLSLPRELKCGVMLNADDFISLGEDCLSTLNKLFRKSENSPIDLIRVAVNIDAYKHSKLIINFLRDLGYEIGLNLMKANALKLEVYQKVSKDIKSWECVDVLYFADSLGSMGGADVTTICKALLKEWDGPLGIHSHDNKGLSLSNSLTAIQEGATWCDSTILGMGRGAGNTSTEAILMELSDNELHKGLPQELVQCSNLFQELKKEYSWGPNPYYHYAACHGIHPTYVQSLLADQRYAKEDFFSILARIARSPASSYSDANLREAVYPKNSVDKDGDWDATNWLTGKNVLLVGSGSSVRNYSQAILNYVKQEKPFVVALNINQQAKGLHVDATIVAHEQRIFLDSGSYEKLAHPIIMPKGNFLSKVELHIENLEVLDYGLSIRDEAFEIRDKGCTLSSPLTLGYALSVLTQGNAKEIKLVGFDGYGARNPKQDEVSKTFICYQDLPKSLPIESLTPTTYPIQQGSIFAPKLALNDFLVVIPARFQSSRFPGKPLADLCGKSLIRHVWDKSVKAVGVKNVIVATDDKRIMDHCTKQGMEVLLTSTNCLTGTDRLAEVAQKIKKQFYINVQGDEPLIEPSDIIKIIEVARKNPKLVVNGMCKIDNEKQFRSSNVPKVVTSRNRNLLFISRGPIPTSKNHEFIGAMRQVCIYAFPRDLLIQFGNQKTKSHNEQIEDIEILRFLDLGFTVKMVEIKGSSIAVDCKEDLEQARVFLKSKSP
jgi:4-hydroxy 2-oxovalerate aldolase